MALILLYFPLLLLQVLLQLRILRHKCEGPCELFDSVSEHLLADAEEVLLQVYLQSPAKATPPPPKAFSLTDGKIATGMRTKEELTEELTDVRGPRSRAQAHFSKAQLLLPISTTEYRTVSGRMEKSDMLFILIKNK